MQPREEKWTTEGRTDRWSNFLPSFLPQFLISSYESPFACGRAAGREALSHNIIPSTQPREKGAIPRSLAPSLRWNALVRPSLFPFSLPLPMHFSSLQARAMTTRRTLTATATRPSGSGPTHYATRRLQSVPVAPSVRPRPSVRLSDVAK